MVEFWCFPKTGLLLQVVVVMHSTQPSQPRGYTSWHRNEPRAQKWLKKARQKWDSQEVDEEAVTVFMSWCLVNWSHSKWQPFKVTLGKAFPQTHFPLSHGESRPGFVYSSR